MSDKHTIIDLFSGCGGFGLGAEIAGFHTLVAVDVDPILQSSYKKNFPKTKVVINDLSQMDELDWKQLIGSKKVDGVIGGPPCQGYSRIGKNDIADPRRGLLSHFFRNVMIIKPKFFVMENVEGLMDEKNYPELISALELVKKDYVTLDPIIIDASKMGVPTTRKRVLVIGYDPDYFENFEHEKFVFRSAKVTVRDAISDLPLPVKQNKDINDLGWSSYTPKKKLSSYAKKMRKLRRGLGCKESCYEVQMGKVSGVFETIHSEEIKKRYGALRPGEIDKVSKSKKLDWDGFSPTLRAGTGADKGSYQAVRPIHPVEGRVITVREAARLQGFPDWFIFHNTKWHSFRMIGNSVSPIVSEKILKKIKDKIN